MQKRTENKTLKSFKFASTHKKMCYALKVMPPNYFNRNPNRYREHNNTVEKFSAEFKFFLCFVATAITPTFSSDRLNNIMKTPRLIMVWCGWVLWYINPWRLFNAKFCLYIYIYDLSKHFVDNIFKEAWSLIFGTQLKVGWLVGLFYGVSTLFGSFNTGLNFKQFSLV